MISMGYDSSKAQSTGDTSIWGDQSQYLNELFGMGSDLVSNFSPANEISDPAIAAYQQGLTPGQNPYLDDMTSYFGDQLGILNQQSGGEAGLAGAYGGGRQGVAESLNTQNIGQQMGLFLGDQYQADADRAQQSVLAAPDMLALSDPNQQWQNLQSYSSTIGAPVSETYTQSTDKSKAMDFGILSK